MLIRQFGFLGGVTTSLSGVLVYIGRWIKTNCPEEKLFDDFTSLLKFADKLLLWHGIIEGS